MTHRHIETITFGACLVICAHTHTHTHAHTHFDIGRGTVGLPSLQPIVGGWGGASLLLSHIFQRGLENYRGGGDSRVREGALFFVSQVVFYWICIIFD